MVHFQEILFLFPETLYPLILHLNLFFSFFEFYDIFSLLIRAHGTLKGATLRLAIHVMLPIKKKRYILFKYLTDFVFCCFTTVLFDWGLGLAADILYRLLQTRK